MSISLERQNLYIQQTCRSINNLVVKHPIKSVISSLALKCLTFCSLVFSLINKSFIYFSLSAFMISLGIDSLLFFNSRTIFNSFFS